MQPFITAIFRNTRLFSTSKATPKAIQKFSESYLPTSASNYLLKHTRALGIKFTPANDIYGVLPKIQIDESSLPFLLPQLKPDTLDAMKRNLTNDSTLSVMHKSFIKKLYDVVVNSKLNIGTEESKTDSLVDDMLRSVGLNNFPLVLENHPRFTVHIGGQRISAIPEFVVRQCNLITESVCVVVEDKHIKNISAPSGLGESQISIEILSAAYENYMEEFGKGNEKNQTIYAIRVISHYVTFYRATVTLDYLKALTFGIPETSTFEIIRFPGLNGKESGLDLIDVEQRKVALSGMASLGLAPA